jgi:hypothetical protein
VEVLLAHEISRREVRPPTRFTACQRDRATVLVCCGAHSGIRGSGLLAIYRELAKGLKPVPREQAVKQSSVTFAAAYLATAPQGEVWAVVDRALVDARSIDLASPVDAVAWNVRDSWVVDVISVAVRPGQLKQELSGGRIQRAIDAAEGFLSPGGEAEVRLWSHLLPQALSAATVRCASLEVTRPADALGAVA